jgi:hypothetical protein
MRCAVVTWQLHFILPFFVNAQLTQLLLLSNLLCACLQDQLRCADLAVAALRGTCCLLTALHTRTSAAAAAAASATATPNDASAAAAAAAAAALGGHVLQQLQQLAHENNSTLIDADSSRKLAIVSAAPAAAAALLSSNRLSSEQLAAAAQQAQQVACSAGVDGRVAGAAAFAWAQLVCMKMSHSSSSVSEKVGVYAHGLCSSCLLIHAWALQQCTCVVLCDSGIVMSAAAVAAA